MRHPIWFSTFLFALPSLAAAQVTVKPRESRPGAEERYTVRVPAPPTELSASAATPMPQGMVSDSAAIETWLKGYDDAFNAKDLEALATFYHPDVTIFEGGGMNVGWADYRDNHLGPELKAFENLQFAHRETKVTLLSGGQSAYVTARYNLKARMEDREVDSEGLATYVLVKGDDGWKIRHSHTSSRRRPSG